jgi:hypothetical protein
LFAVQKTEPWENEKCEADIEKYVSEGSQSQRTVDECLTERKAKTCRSPEVIEQYARNVTRFQTKVVVSSTFFFPIH